MQNNVIKIRNASLYGSQTSLVDFACKTAPLGTELQVSIGPEVSYRGLHTKQSD